MAASFYDNLIQDSIILEKEILIENMPSSDRSVVLLLINDWGVKALFTVDTAACGPVVLGSIWK